MVIKKRLLQGNALGEKALMGLAEIFAKNIDKGDIILLEGPLGIGKTFFSRAIINARCLIDKLEIEEVPSPTFSIIQEYDLRYFSIFSRSKLYKIFEKFLSALSVKKSINLSELFCSNSKSSLKLIFFDLIFSFVV